MGSSQTCVKMVCVRMRSCVLTVLLLNIFYSVVSSVYFHIGESEKKCFIEDMPDETLFIGNFQSQLYDKQRDKYLPANQDLWIFVEAKDPDDKLVLSQPYDSVGSFKFTSHKPGRHQICLYVSSSQRPLSARGMLVRIHTSFQLAAKENLPELWLRVQQLTEQVRQIQSELDHLRLTEKHFREVDHSTNMWIFWWPVMRSLYIVAFIMWNTSSW